MISHFEAPFIFGMNALVDTNREFYVKACREVLYEILPREAVLSTVEQQGLWKDAAWIYMYGIKRFKEVNQISAGLNTYETVRENLLNPIKEKEELRLTVNASHYVQEKSNLSRSRVMKILSDLRIGGHIEIKRGILMSLNKLPEKY